MADLQPQLELGVSDHHRIRGGSQSTSETKPGTDTDNGLLWLGEKKNRPPFPVERTAGYATCSAWSIGVLMRDPPARTRLQRIRSRIYLTLLNGTIVHQRKPECNRLRLPDRLIRHRKVGCNATVMAGKGRRNRPPSHAEGTAGNATSSTWPIGVLPRCRTGGPGFNASVRCQLDYFQRQYYTTLYRKMQ
jgi:hypothetical protein